MARTAPVPNFPAIPGMNPGLFVLGGGGDGGGSGAGGGKGKGKGQGADGKNGGKDAKGGGKGAGNCGPGSGSGCTNPSHGGGGGTHAGDPIDPISGRVYTLAQTDLQLTGRLPFTISRTYSSSAAERDIGMGFGWSHSLAWEIETRRRTLVIHRPTGTSVVRDIPTMGASVQIADGVKLTREAGGYVLCEGPLVYVLSPSPVTSSRYLLTAVADRAGHRITLHHEEDVLAGLTDSVGRRVLVLRHRDGRIRGLEIHGKRGRREVYRTYEYDDRGDMVATVDAAGRRMRMVYIEDHLLAEVHHPSGMVTHYRYDDASRCVETWCDHGGAPDPALAADVPAVLADGVTPAKGVLHVRIEHGPDFSMVFDSTMGRRLDHGPGGKVATASGVWVETLDYDSDANVIAYHAPDGSTTRLRRDADGRIVAVTDASGASETFGYDAHGNLVEAIDALGAGIQYTYDDAHHLLEARDALGVLLTCSYDVQGARVAAVMPNGGVSKMEHDDDGNVTAVVEPNGKARLIQYDDFGRVLGFRDEEGNETRCHYDPCGTLIGVTQPDGSASHIDLDAAGRVTRYVGAGGEVYELLWGGCNVVHELRKPNGDVLQFRYDRECRLTEVVNEAGERYRCERDAAGRIVGERHFDGRHHHYTLDPRGLIRQTTNTLGERTVVEHDAGGRPLKRTYADGSFEAFAYDAVGRLVLSETPATRCEYKYDSRGNLVEEVQEHGGVRTVVRSTYDATGKRTSIAANSGYCLRVEHDAMRLPAKIWLDDRTPIELTHDGLGREICRTLSASCHILTRYDGLGRVLEQRAVKAVTDPAGPQWVGDLPPGTVVQESFGYDASGELVERNCYPGTKLRFEHDRLGRVTEQSVEGGERRTFGYGPCGRVLETTPGAAPRSFGPGGVILAHGDRSFEYDQEGRRIRSVQAPSGGASTLEWGPKSMLQRMMMPDGTRLEYEYDAHARRVQKRVVSPGGRVATTRFVWSGDQMLQEIHEQWDAGKRVASRRVDCVYRDDAVAPLCHREVGDGGDGQWVHYVLGPGLAPSFLIGGDGQLLARVSVDLWGALRFDATARARTPWGYAGMYHDRETGLVYQRHRYYDPATGQYLSPDPLGVGAALNAWEYAHSQPLRVIDPTGLAPVTTTVSGNAGPNGAPFSTDATSGGPPGDIHPVVAAALPPRQPNAPGGVYPRGNTQSPTACGEPRAISAYLREWERNNNGGRELDPQNPNDRAQIQRALGSMGNISSKDDKGARAPCPNCSQMIANLYNQYGAPNPNGPNTATPGTTLVTPGATTRGGADSVNFSPPAQSWVDQQRANPVQSGMAPFGPADPNQNRPPTGPAYGPWDSYNQAGTAGAAGRRTP